jgi:DNA-binding response OmpR family regulator
MARLMLATDPGPPLARGLLRVFLESAGHEVYEVHDGEAALAELDAVRPELLILDTALPTLDGVQVLARLKLQPNPARVPVLVISAIPPQLGRRLVESLGATRYLPKPFAYQTLGDAVEAVLAPCVATAEPGAHANSVHGTNGNRPRALADAAPPLPSPERERPAG